MTVAMVTKIFIYLKKINQIKQQIYRWTMILHNISPDKQGYRRS